MAVVFACGAEHTSEFTTSHWFSNTPGSGAATVDTTHVDSGGSAIKITADALLRKIANTGRHFSLRMRIWVPTGAISGTRIIELDDGAQRLLQYSTVAGKLQWYNGTESTLAFPLDQWVTVDLQIDASANPHVANWRINGVAQTQATAAAAANNVVQYYLGGGSSSTGSRWVDNLGVSLTAGEYPLPAGSVVWSGSAEVWIVYHEAAATASASATVAGTAGILHEAAAALDATATVAADITAYLGIEAAVTGTATASQQDVAVPIPDEATASVVVRGGSLATVSLVPPRAAVTVTPGPLAEVA